MEKRNTIQKQLVLDAVFRLANHPTAEEVYAEVARSHPTVSKATVYRNLGSLSEDGLLRHIKMPGGACLLYTSSVTAIVFSVVGLLLAKKPVKPHIR